MPFGYIHCSDGVTIVIPTRDEIFAEMAEKFRCKKCNEIWGINLANVMLSKVRCPHCDADIMGKVYPKKRETPKEVKVFEIVDNPELDQILLQVIQDNPKPVADYYAGKVQSVGFLVGQVMKKIKTNPAEAKQRLETKLKELNVRPDEAV